MPTFLDLAKMKNLEVWISLPPLGPEFTLQLSRVKSQSNTGSYDLWCP